MRKGDLTIAFKVIALSNSLSECQKRVGAALLDHFNRKTGRCDPSLATLAAILGISRRTVVRAVKDLAAFGFIKKVRHRGNHQTNQYTPVWPRFREADAGWAARRRQHSARFERAEMSPAQCRDGHLSGDKGVTQTNLNNLSYRTSRFGSPDEEHGGNARAQTCHQSTTMELKDKSHHADARVLHVKSTNSRDVMRETARRRWDNELLRRFRKHEQLYGRIIDLVDGPMAEAATDAELQRRHAGAEYIVCAVAILDLEIATELEQVSGGIP